MKVIDYLKRQKGLNDNEAQAAYLLAKGLNPTEIAAEAKVNYQIVRHYINGAYRKLGVRTYKGVEKICRPYMGMALEVNRAKI